MQTNGKKGKLVVVLHQATSSAGRVGQYLQLLGFELDIYRPVLGDKLPETLQNHEGAIIFGGPMSANDSASYIREETEWLSVPLHENKPFLGICLGAQMLANHIGGQVKAHNGNEVEIGWYPIIPTKLGESLIQWPEMVYHFHTEGIYDLPKDIELLARGSTYPIQAFRYGQNAWGIQFHAELTRVMMQRWIVHGADRLSLKGAQPAQSQIKNRFIYDPALKQWLVRVLKMIFDKSKIN